MVDKVARTSQQRETTRAWIVGSSDKVEKGTGLKQHTPKVIAQKKRKQKAKKSRCRRDKKIRNTIEEGHQNPRKQ